ncbi:alpha-hydroxy acid oxidase [Shimia abyssi]|uniref:L-lactate dehydrogenase (Cytochrome) n=1 Tax=Shimia abyssi TaxID=1662395 RepID=A0A2P8F1Y4_9RHOB|nr:alpha-hydroxy acid oxidase [Shimia abyssi]PSL15709.1 L-lactate dehydrogenase (cytochrome) [Shimia abyssi]
MALRHCHNFHDFRLLAKRRLPGPIFNYIDGGADDEVTYRKNSAAFDKCDLLPSVLTGVSDVDMSVTVMGQRLDMPIYCSPTALQRLFHHQGERAVAAAAEKYGTLFGVSSLGTVSLEELRKKHKSPQVYQFYFHKDRGLNAAMMQRAKEAGVEVMMLTVDSITGGNRERDLRTGFSIPFRLTLGGMIQFAIKPMWGINYVTHEKFHLPQLEDHVDMGGGASSIGGYFSEMLDPSMNWDDVAQMVRDWDGQFCLKGIMTAEDAKRAAEIGCTGIVLSNHGGRQLDGSRTPFDQLAEIMDAVGDRIDVMMDSGIQRGTHVLKALSLGAKAVGIGRGYLYALAAAGQPGVERALGLMKAEIERDMKLMGATSIDQLSRENLRSTPIGAAMNSQRAAT